MARTRVKLFEDTSKPSAPPVTEAPPPFDGLFGPEVSAPPPAEATLPPPVEEAPAPKPEVPADALANMVLGIHGALSSIDPRFGPVTTLLFDDEDWIAFHVKFTEWLDLGDRRGDQGSVRQAHEQGPKMLRLAQKIYLQVKNARERWESENDVALGSLRESARLSLEDDKAKKKITGTITKDDILARAATIYPDEFRLQEMKRREHKAVEARAAHDVEVAAQRCRGLDKMMDRLL